MKSPKTTNLPIERKKKRSKTTTTRWGDINPETYVPEAIVCKELTTAPDQGGFGVGIGQPKTRNEKCYPAYFKNNSNREEGNETAVGRRGDSTERN